jgi:CheY-like chemotaxis protein
MGKRLLLADDSITIQKVIQITFAHEDYELTITDNGDQAFAMARELKPDLVMADVYMPGKNGYELAAAIKQDAELQGTAVLLLAGSFEPFDEDKARSCQADAWIEKPFESQSLIDKVAELLSAAPSVAAAPVEKPVPAPAAEPATAAAETPAAPVSEAEALPDDPFADISFAEAAEPEAAEPEAVEQEPATQTEEPAAFDDDWSDVSLDEIPATASAVEEFAVEDSAEPAFVTKSEAVDDDFTFIDEQETPAAEVSAEAEIFEMADDEIMPLGDDDILEAEDLEPPAPEQTLASWSRGDAGTDDLLAEDFVEEDALEAEDSSAFTFAEEEPAAETESLTAFEEPTAEAPVVAFEEAVAEPAAAPAAPEPEVEAPEPEVEAPVFEAEPEPVAAVATAVSAGAVEERAAALSEEDLARIVEKVVAGVVEKLAGSILERVAWEVVPDLAENLIREEIRKIKDAAA